MADNFDLINARKQAKYSQEILASILGVSRSHLANMETGAKPLNDSALAFIERRQTVEGAYGRRANKKRNNQLIENKENSGKIANLQLIENKRVIRRREKWGKAMGIPKKKREWEAWWWRELNARCLQCANSCKQSSFVSIIACPQYQAGA